MKHMLQNERPVPPVKGENCSRGKGTKETWPLNATCQPGLNAGPEKRGDIFKKVVKFAWGLDDSVAMADFLIQIVWVHQES